MAELQPPEHPGEAHGRERLGSTADQRAAPKDAFRGEDFGEPLGSYPIRVNEIDHQAALLSVGQIVALIGLAWVDRNEARSTLKRTSSAY